MNFRLKIFVHLTRSLTSFQEISTISTSEQIRPFFRILNFLDRFFQSSFEHNQKILGVIFFEVSPVSKRSASMNFRLKIFVHFDSKSYQFPRDQHDVEATSS